MPRNPNNSSEFIAGQLPKIKHKGKEYFVDGRMKELRNVSHPMDKFDGDSEFYSLSKKKQDIIIFEFYGITTSN